MAEKSDRHSNPVKDHLPSKQEIADFIHESPHKVGKRHIAQAFNIKGGARIALKRILREMAEEGLIKGSHKRFQNKESLPPVCVLELISQEEHGDFVAVPIQWKNDSDAALPHILIKSKKNGRYEQSLEIGGRVLARLEERDEGEDGELCYHAYVIKNLPQNDSKKLGIYRTIEGRGGVIDPVNRKHLKEWAVSQGDEGEAKNGDLIEFEPLKAGHFVTTRARILRSLGNPKSQRLTSLIAIETHGLPSDFPERLAGELQALSPPSLGAREDLRALPMITIDPDDARDHDDAVWAAPDEDPENKKGWVVIVAIADVAHYIRPGSNLDREALRRGNSVYFPDQVVPMLPEKISNDLCSLRAEEERPSLAVRMVFDGSGRKRSHRFMRILMRSVAKLSYTQAQLAFEENPDEVSAPLMETTLRSLWRAYQALKKARDKRAPLDLNLPERKLKLTPEGQIEEILFPPRLEAHRLIEEFMIQANIAAAETLEAKKAPLIYRIHDAPPQEKLAQLSDFLATMKIKLAKGGRIKPSDFNFILAQAKGRDIQSLVNEVVLRCQSQAEYSAANLGHFGLNLRHYAHFTSPIRRYADLIVHRALIAALDLGEGGQRQDQAVDLKKIAEIISNLERRAMAAERETVDRLISEHLSEKIGTRFAARISGVSKSGLFVSLHDSGANGFIPISTLGADYFLLDENRQTLVGDVTGETFRLGDQVEVRLIEVIPAAGALRFSMLTEGHIEKRKNSSSRKKYSRGREGAKKGAHPRKRRAR